MCIYEESLLVEQYLGKGIEILALEEAEWRLNETIINEMVMAMYYFQALQPKQTHPVDTWWTKRELTSYMTDNIYY